LAHHALKVVDDGAEGWVPAGCSYSRKHGQRAVFNRNPAGRSSASYPLVCTKDATRARPHWYDAYAAADAARDAARDAALAAVPTTMQPPEELATEDLATEARAPEASSSSAAEAAVAPAEPEDAPAAQPSRGGPHWLVSKSQQEALASGALASEALASEALASEALGSAPGGPRREAQQQQQAHFDAWEDAPRPWEAKSNASRDATADARIEPPPLHEAAAHALASGEAEEQQAHFEAWEDAPRPWNARGETPARHAGHTAAAARTVSALAAHPAERAALLRPPTRAAFARDHDGINHHPYDPYLEYRHLAPQDM